MAAAAAAEEVVEKEEEEEEALFAAEERHLSDWEADSEADAEVRPPPPSPPSPGLPRGRAAAAGALTPAPPPARPRVRRPPQPATSLFEATQFPSAREALAHDAAAHGFSLPRLAARHGLAFYDLVKVVNFVRSEVAAGRRPREADFAADAAAAGPPGWQDDRHLRPFLANDAVLFELDELLDPAVAAGSAAAGPAAGEAREDDGGPGRLALFRKTNKITYYPKSN